MQFHLKEKHKGETAGLEAPPPYRHISTFSVPFRVLLVKGVSAGWVPPAPQHLWMVWYPSIFGIRLKMKMIAMSKSQIISMRFFR